MENLKPVQLFKVFMPESVIEPLRETLLSGYIGQGPKVDQFEKAISPWVGHQNVVSVNSGTSALYLALKLSGVCPGDTVLGSPQTCIASNTPILDHYANITWADIDPWTGNIDPLDVERKITPKTKAVIAVHWGGYPCEIAELLRITRKYGIPLIEDAAHAFGAEYHGKKIGGFSPYTAFSFQAIKHLTSVTPETRVLVRRNQIIGLPKIGDLDSSVMGSECASFGADGCIKWSKITNFIQHPIDDVILKLKTEKGREVEVTNTHSVFSYDGSRFFPKVAKDLKVGDWILMPRRLPFNEERTAPLDILELLPHLPILIRNGRVKISYEGRGANAGKWTDRFIPISIELCKALGYYVAEGSVSNWSRNGKKNNRTICTVFSFGAHEEHTHVQDLIDCLQAAFPSFTASKYRTKNPATGMKVVFGARLFAEMIVSLNCGVGAHNKRIPDLMWTATRECKLAFIEALINGDGHRRNLKDQMEHESFVSCSEELTTGLHYLLLTLGIQSSMAVIHGTNKSGSKSTGYTLTIINRRAYGLQSKCLENMVPRIFTKGSNSRKERVLISKIVSENIPVPAELLKDVALLKISKIEQRPYKGDVFDFSVDGDENFIGGYGAFCLHNTGDGGALTIQSNDSYRSAKLLRWYGIDREVSRKDLRCEEDVIRTGSKLHMNDICATIGLEQLKYVEKNLATTRDNAKFYDQALAGLKHVRLLRYAGDRRSSYWLYSIRVSDLDGLQDYLAARGIMASKVHVRNDLHTAFRPFRCNLPGVDEFSREQISIPVGWWVTPEDRARIAQAVVEWDRAQ